MDYIFEDDLFEVGAEVDAYCTRCKTDTPHTVLTKYEDEIRSVLCTTCNTSHAYRPPRGETEEEIPEPISVRRRQALQKLSWSAAMEQVDTSASLPYSPGECYVEGQVLEHPVFGVGYVSEVLSDTKLEAIFEDGNRLLVHNRVDLPAASRPVKKTGKKVPKTAKKASNKPAKKQPTPTETGSSNKIAPKKDKAKTKKAAKKADKAPKTPKTPEAPKKDADRKVAENKPAKAMRKPAKKATKKPAKASKKPAKKAPKKPSKSTPKKPSKSTPKKTSKKKTSKKKTSKKKPAKPTRKSAEKKPKKESRKTKRAKTSASKRTRARMKAS